MTHATFLIPTFFQLLSQKRTVKLLPLVELLMLVKVMLSVKLLLFVKAPVFVELLLILKLLLFVKALVFVNLLLFVKLLLLVKLLPFVKALLIVQLLLMKCLKLLLCQIKAERYVDLSPHVVWSQLIGFAIAKPYLKTLKNAIRVWLSVPLFFHTITREPIEIRGLKFCVLILKLTKID